VTRRSARRAAARESILEQAARSLSIVNTKFVPRAARDEANEVAAELITVANAAL
jgi:hypothetical protein